MTAVSATGPASRADNGGGSAIGEFDIALILADLDDYSVRAINRRALEGAGVTLSSVLGRSALELIAEDDRASAREAIDAMRDGTIDFYRAHRRFVDRSRAGTVWVQALRFGDRPVALAQIAYGGEHADSPLAEFLGRPAFEMAVGTVDATGIITSVSTDITEFLGVNTEEAIGRSLVGRLHEGDVRRLFDAERLARTDAAVGLHVRVRAESGAWRPMFLVLSALAGSREFLFALLPDLAPPTDTRRAVTRVAQLEDSLWRIGAEVAASGVWFPTARVPDPATFPQLADMTPRQREVLRRLVRGERVSTIAAGLSVSQSTVRNHLAHIFERFGVHSQAELLALFEREPTAPTDGQSA
jgi:PAS domain S-box-containing protein